MARPGGPRWLKTLGGVMKIVWPLVGAVLILLGLAYESMSIISSTRAYVNGESLWSKGHKDAVFYLIEYSRTGDEHNYRLFEQAMSVPLGDRKARLNLDGPTPDHAIARAGFLQAACTPMTSMGWWSCFSAFATSASSPPRSMPGRRVTGTSINSARWVTRCMPCSPLATSTPRRRSRSTSGCVPSTAS